ncbi:hypothetical protein [Pseudoalteromonas obscura]|uniref:Uncharacterized protein n=1 Tax=Pseudoalteromonas obscura TaxID=3048491 RepID=A0ABT7EHA2_9GAMM|nr:hypothetical protein [Pseudoalteromonas sp. P94(2023)]MDK2594434.1 hypothetical protein [Pseudoalteromonas sp. P94(2023)]
MTESELYTYYTAIAAAIAAAFSAGAAIYQAYANKKHQNASVMPLLVDYIDLHGLSTGGNLKLLIKNQGLGPAIISRYSFFWKDKQVLHNELLDVSHELLGSRFAVSLSEYQAGYAFSAGDVVTIFEIEFLNQKGKFNEDDRLVIENFVAEAVKNFRLEVDYHSLLSKKRYKYTTMPNLKMLQVY